MAAKVSYFKIGLFVVVAAILCLTGVVLLGAAAMFQDSFDVVTYLDESAQGLAVGAPVKIRGVKVGEIGEIALAGSKYALPGAGLAGVEEVHARTYVVVTLKLTDGHIVRNLKALSGKSAREITEELTRRGWRVRRASSGITGPPFIELVDTGDEAIDITNIPWRDQHDRQVYIPATASFSTQVTSAVERLAENLGKADVAGLATQLQAVASKLDDVVKNIQQADIAGLVGSTKSLIEKQIAPSVDNFNKQFTPVLANIEKGTKGLPETLEHIKSVSVRVDRIAESLDKRLPSLLDSATSVVTNADKTVQAVGKSMADDVTPALADLKQAAAALRKLTERDIDPTLANIHKVSDQAPATVEQVNALLRKVRLGSSASLAKLDKAAEDLQAVAANLRQLTERASRYPAQMLFGEPPPPALQKKGK